MGIPDHLTCLLRNLHAGQEEIFRNGHRITCMHAKSLQSCLSLCDPIDCSPWGSSVLEILHARILEWVVLPFSRGPSQSRDQTVSLISPLHWQVGCLPLALPGHGKTDWFKTGRGVPQGCIPSPCLFNCLCTLCSVHHVKCQWKKHKLESRLSELLTTSDMQMKPFW